MRIRSWSRRRRAASATVPSHRSKTVIWTAGVTPSPAGKWLHLQKARLFFEKMLGYANHLGLYGEELGPQAQHLGNLPPGVHTPGPPVVSRTSCVVRLNPRIMRCADDAILVLNAGSSSMKLAVFAGRGGELALELRGAVDGLYTMPCFQAHDPTGRVSSPRNHGAERPWVTKG